MSTVTKTVRPLHLAAIGAALLMSASALFAADKEKPFVAEAEVVKITATVQDIDYAKRTVELKGPEGNVATFKVDKSAVNFDQVKKGDQVNVEYLESVAVFVTSKGGPPEADVAAMVALAPKGQKPAGVVAQTMEIKAKITAIDQDARTVTLEGPLGNSRTFKVDKSVTGLKDVKVGDDVVLRYTEAVALTVTKP